MASDMQLSRRSKLSLCQFLRKLPDPDKWGSILTELKKKNTITKDQEVGLAGVYRFLSPGSHKPQTEREYVRMARHLAVSMAYFLLKARKGASNEF